MLWKRILAVLLATAGIATPAFADVIEIGDGGAVRVRTGGGDVQWIDADASGDAAAIEDAPEVVDAAITQIDAPQVPAAWAEALTRVAQGERLSPNLLAALVWQESRWQAAALSPKGAVGLAQLMPATARALAVDPRDPAANLAGGARYLRQMLDLFDGDVERALAAYNAGPGRVQAARGVPAIRETQAYVSTILDRLSPVPAVTVASYDMTGLMR